ncbi:MAG: hypothetical protein ACE5GA_07870, partial [Candidatus Zixiibacteriota bacterium]
YLISLVAPGHDGKIFVTTLFPLTILFLDRAFQRNAVLNFALLGCVIGVIILSPHPQMSYFTLWALGFYAMYLLYQRFKAKMPLAETSFYAGGFALAVALGLGISAIQFYPGVEYTREYSPRADTKSGYQWATSWSLHTEDVVGLIAPEFSGTKANPGKYPNVRYWGQNAFKDNSEYAGVVALFLAVVGAFFYRRKGIFFGGLALFALSYALADTTPLFKIYFHLIPNVKSMRAASMIMFMFSFCISLLAAMGVHWIKERYTGASARTRARFRKHLIVSVSTLGSLALLWSLAGEGALSAYGALFYDGLKSGSTRGPGRWQQALANLPSIQTGFWISLSLVGAAAGAIWLMIRGSAPRWVLLALPLLVFIDGVRFNQRFIETVPESRLRQLFGPNALTQFIKSQAGTFRTMHWGVFSGDYLPQQGIEVVSGYHGNQLRWYDDLLGGPAQVSNHLLGGQALRNITNPAFLNLVGARFLVLPKRHQIPAGHFGEKPLSLVRDFGKVGVYENPNYFPRAFYVDSLEVVPDRGEITRRVLSGAHNLREVVFAEKTPPGWTQSRGIPDVDSLAVDSVALVTSGADSIVVDCDVEREGILVVTTSFYDAWRPEIDGRPVELFRVNGAFLGVRVSPEARRIVFRYDSGLYRTGKKITYTSFLVALIGVAYGWRRSRMKTMEPPSG